MKAQAIDHALAAPVHLMPGPAARAWTAGHSGAEPKMFAIKPTVCGESGLYKHLDCPNYHDQLHPKQLSGQLGDWHLQYIVPISFLQPL